MLLGYLAVSLLFAWELLTPGRTLYRWDALIYNWPIALETRSQWLSGHLPFWAASFCCGTPLLENINAGVLYPLRVLCWVLPLIPGYHLFLFLHVWFSLVGMHLLLRRGMRLSNLAAFAGALAYAASGYARNMWDTHNFMALPWIPLGLAALMEARRPAWRPFAAPATALCWSMMILGGDFQAACLWAPAAFLLVLFSRERVVRLRAFATALFLALLLTAPQWLPSYFAAAQSYRAEGLPYIEVVERSFNPVRLVELLMPNAFGSHSTWFGAALAGERATRTFPWTASFHAGVFILLLCALALRRRHHPHVRWAALLFIAPLFLSFGRFLPGFNLWLSLPVLRHFRYPEKYLLWSTLGLAVLAAHGAATAAALWRRSALAPLRRRILGCWSLATVLNGGAATALFFALTGGPSGARAWAAGRWTCLACLLAAVWLISLVRVRRRITAARILTALLLIDALLWWYVELPTAGSFDPLSPTAVARLVRSSDRPWGRVLRDPALTKVPLPPGYGKMPTPQRAAVFSCEALDLDTPRMWGLYSANGFSPMEAEAMRSLRSLCLQGAGGEPPDVDGLAEFCRLAGVEWLLTTGERADQLAERGFEIQTVREWQRRAISTRLVRIGGVAQAECVPRAPAGGAKVLHIWRARPGRIRIDLQPGGAADLLVRETYAPGWRARDANGRGLPVYAVSNAFLGVSVPAHVSQVRLTYAPVGWRRGLLIAAAGLLLTAGLLAAALGERRLRTALLSPAACAAFAALLFLIVGTAARNHWSCTYDEGFHISRGLTRLHTGDSRLCYFHPPAQNLVCAYFANLAHSERMYLPATNPAWEHADVGQYAVDLATVNRGLFPDLIQAARWGTALFGAALCALLAIWAAQAAGPLAGWLTALGAGLCPNLLAHGNVVTTDMGVTFLALSGTFALWHHVRSNKQAALAWATIAFVLAALTKHTGLIWLLAFLTVCLPLLAICRRSPGPLAFIPLALVLFTVILILLYGVTPQVIRAVPSSWWNGKVLPAGRYIEGLLTQGQHAVDGHLTFFRGRQFVQGTWWHMAAALVLKNSPLWFAAGLAALLHYLLRRRFLAAWIPWAPALVFALLLFFANRMAIGVRHALPLQALLVLTASLWCARIPRIRLRITLCLLLATASLITCVTTFPDYLSYFPAWTGGTRDGYRWMVDSNYDWGQDLGLLEEDWAALTEAAGGEPPRLMYYGFTDPRVIYDLPLGPSSLGGYMESKRMSREPAAAFADWVRGLNSAEGPAAASISALKLCPLYGLDLTALERSP
ncbi:MAG: hypothetical protein JXB04_03130, partial [Kiritimatiellae bacterium]|nr:hypothetical protein [Kiritimatiellia bacterium]